VAERCEGCGFEYDLDRCGAAADDIEAGVAEMRPLLVDATPDVRVRPAPETWSVLEYGCHMRDVLLVQRERVLAARRTDTPTCPPMGRDERVEHDGYAAQHPDDVARQLTDAAAMFANVLRRLAPEDWDRTLMYNYPHPWERPLRWVAIHTVHEVRHHLGDMRG
jgi:hypothetical protein